MAIRYRRAFDQSDAATKGVAATGLAVGMWALFCAGACCVLPLLFAALGIGAGALAVFVPFHWPMTILAAMAAGVGWLIYWRKRMNWVKNGSVTSAPLNKATTVMLSLATLFAALSALWPFLFEAPFMRLLAAT